MAGRVMHHSGPYEGMEIDYVVEMDPAYILEVASTVRGHGISQTAISRARQLLDTYQDEDFEDEEEVRELYGFHIEEYGNE